MSLLDLLVSGGPVMVPILLCSILTCAFILQRILGGYRRSRVIPKDLYSRLIDLMRKHEFCAAFELCQLRSNSLTRIFSLLIQHRDLGREALSGLIERAGRLEARFLMHRIGALQTITAVAPLLGLLGTITGMMRIFFAAKEVGVGDPNLLSGGIAEALIATASGLCVAIVSLVFSRYFASQAKSIIADLESMTSEALDIVTYTSSPIELD